MYTRPVRNECYVSKVSKMLARDEYIKVPHEALKFLMITLAL